jgi:hypothetical protein
MAFFFRCSLSLSIFFSIPYFSTFLFNIEMLASSFFFILFITTVFTASFTDTLLSIPDLQNCLADELSVEDLEHLQQTCSDIHHLLQSRWFRIAKINKYLQTLTDQNALVSPKQQIDVEQILNELTFLRHGSIDTMRYRILHNRYMYQYGSMTHLEYTMNLILWKGALMLQDKDLDRELHYHKLFFVALLSFTTIMPRQATIVFMFYMWLFHLPMKVLPLVVHMYLGQRQIKIIDHTLTNILNRM